MASVKKSQNPHKNLYLVGVLCIALVALFMSSIRMLDTTSKTPKEFPSTIKPTPTTKLIEFIADNTAINDWKTYTDPKYNFTIQYPLTWIMGQPGIFSDNQIYLPDFMNNAYGISFTINNPTEKILSPLFVSMIVNENPRKWSLAQWLKTKEINAGRTPQNQNINILIDNKQGISERSQPDFEDISLNYISKDTKINNIYSFGFGGNGEGGGNYQDNDPFVQKERTNFHNFLATVKFKE